TAGTLEALAALVLFFRYTEAAGRARLFYFLAMAFFAALSMTAKELFAAFPTLLILFAVLFSKDRSRAQKMKQVAAFIVLDVVLVAAFLFAHNRLGNNWGYQGQMNAGRLPIERNLTYDIPNTFLPFSKWIGLYREDLILWPTWLAILAFSTVVLHRLGP